MSSFELFDEYGLENCFIELIEAQECNSRDELHKLEGKHIRELNCVNKIVAGRTRKQHYEENKEQLSLKDKSRYELNKDKVSERQNQMYNCECGGKYTHVHKLRHFKSIKHCQYIESQITKPEVDEV